MQRVLITGAAGGIGTHLRRTMRGLYPHLRLSDAKPIPDPQPDEEIDRTDLSDLAAVERMLEGVNGVVHLGGQAVEADWERVLQANIIGAYNLFEGARRRGVRRVVFATTNHVIGFYPRDRVIDHTVVPRPDSRYGVSKAFGEALASLYADKHGLRCLCIRIGNLDERPQDRRRLSIWVSPRDLTQLIRIGLEHPELHYEIVYGVSKTDRPFWDNRRAHELGYRPEDDAADHADEVLAGAQGPRAHPTDEIAERFQGGPFCSAEFSGDLERTLKR